MRIPRFSTGKHKDLAVADFSGARCADGGDDGITFSLSLTSSTDTSTLHFG